MPTLADIRRKGEVRLREAGFDSSMLEARWLMEAVTGLEGSALRSREQDEAAPEQILLFENVLTRRLSHEPLARIAGWREFWGLRFNLSKETLEPRPDSETVVSTALQHLPDPEAPYRVLDMGTGSGCLLAVLLHELPHAQGVGLDRSFGALQQARRNLTALKLADRAQFVQGDWARALKGPFDLVISNPPYIRTDELSQLSPEVVGHDPYNALFAGDDGLEAYRTLIPQAFNLLRDGGTLVLELGIGQAALVTTLGQMAGFNFLELVDDLGGIPRALVLKKGLE